MSKSCAKCSKTVYPLEELKCLDKIWHKQCFRCSECSMTLNMKTYKGFNKMPYCEAHIPKAKATTVADTPEMKRIQENTKIQSNAAYHAEFEKSKGKFTAVVDDPELLRVKENTKIISMVSYHGDLEKKAVMETKRNLAGEGSDMNSNNGGGTSTSPTYMMDELSSLPTNQQRAFNNVASQQQPAAPKINRGNNYEHNNYSGGGDEMRYGGSGGMGQPVHHTHSPQHSKVISSGGGGGGGGNNSSPYSSRGAPNVIYSSDAGAVNANANAGRKVGSIADYDPVNNFYGSLAPGQSGKVAGGRGPVNNSGMRMAPQQQQAPTNYRQPPDTTSVNGVCYRALYDYEAQDMDEISFGDGDLIVNCTAVEEGWMTGTVQRTGRRGMLPANYVTPAN